MSMAMAAMPWMRSVRSGRSGREHPLGKEGGMTEPHLGERVHHASAALRGSAAVLGACEFQVLAQHPQQADAVGDIRADRLPVHLEVDRHDVLLLFRRCERRGGYCRSRKRWPWELRTTPSSVMRSTVTL